jgi:hypothetical protein
MLRWLLAAGVAAGCSLTSGAYGLRDQHVPCERANRLAYQTLEGMGFTVTAFDVAAIGRPGMLRARREHDGAEQRVTVNVDCWGAGTDLHATEDGWFRSGVEFERAFYRRFTDAQRDTGSPQPSRGLDVRLRPVPGLGAKLDFGVNIAAGGVLPVQVIIDNQTERAYTFDPAEFVLVDANGHRVRPLPLDDVVYKVVWANDRSAAGDVTERLQARLLAGSAVEARQRIEGFLFYPRGTYVEGRVHLEERGSGESEGVVVRFR